MYDIVLSIIASQLVGAFWYSPLCIGMQWSCLAYPGCSLEELQSLLSVKVNYAIGLVSSIFITLLLKFYLLQSVTSVTGALHVAVLLGMFSAVLEICHYAFEGRSLKLFIIDHIHNFLNILVVSCILVAL